jgi:4-diphosphocytidyl-2-C-methyl-D-erythritol kinase
MSLKALYDLPAPAKLNLFLHVVGRRPDGYHLLQSVFVLIDWCDTLHIERRDDGRLHRHDLGPALPADDLCLKAATALQRESGCTLGADISIDKQVPWGAGLGGGSSDAATVLLGLNRLWNLGWSRDRLMGLGLRLGADVPFFIGGRNALVEGIGEQLTPLALAPARFAVVKPAAAIATAAIFASPGLPRQTAPVILAGFLEDTIDLRFPGPDFGNDLQATAEGICTEVAQAARWLEAEFGNSRMTGSGSAVFAHAGTEPIADAGGAASAQSGHAEVSGAPKAAWPVGAMQADSLPPGWVGRVCRSLPLHPLAGWAD